MLINVIFNMANKGIHHRHAAKTVCYPSFGRSNDTQFYIFSQILTSLSTTTTAAAELIDIEHKDKDKEELSTSDTKPTNEDNIGKQAEEEQESNSNTRARGLVHNITIDDIYPSDVISFELPFDNIIPFPQALYQYYFMQCTSPICCISFLWNDVNSDSYSN